jgi:predicted molibdopterin-dependent oxidoreductase YjgC
LVVGAEPLSTHPVAGTLILQALRNSKSKLIVLDALRNEFSYRTHFRLMPKSGTDEIIVHAIASSVWSKRYSKSGISPSPYIKDAPTFSEAAEATGVSEKDISGSAEALMNARNPVILYGPDALVRNGEVLTGLLHLADAIKPIDSELMPIIGIRRQGNSRGAWETGLAVRRRFGIPGTKESIKALYLFLGDDYASDRDLISKVKKVPFIVAQTAYLSPLANVADVIIPSAVWAEREGSYITMDGLLQKTTRVLPLAPGIIDDTDIFTRLSGKLEKRK